MELDPKAKDGNMFVSKFIRVGDRIFTTEPDDRNTRHDDLAQEQGVLDQIAQLKGQESADIDAGQVMFTPPNKLIFRLDSTHLNLPVKGLEDQARQGTVQTAKKLFPSFEVRGEPAK